jgi:hypothetical protein
MEVRAETLVDRRNVPEYELVSIKLIGKSH